MVAVTTGTLGWSRLINYHDLVFFLMFLVIGLRHPLLGSQLGFAFVILGNILLIFFLLLLPGVELIAVLTHLFLVLLITHLQE